MAHFKLDKGISLVHESGSIGKVNDGMHKHS